MLDPKKNRWETDGLLAIRCLAEHEDLSTRRQRPQFEDERERIPRLISEVARTRARAKRVAQSGLISRLEAAANNGDEAGFLNILASVSWEGRSPADFVRAIRLALRIGAPTAAQRIYAEGVSRHERYPDLQRYARLFAPPRIKSRSLPSNPTLKANRGWLNAHRGEYRGRWVAVRNGELLATAASLDELIGQVGDTSNVLLTRA